MDKEIEQIQYELVKVYKMTEEIKKLLKELEHDIARDKILESNLHYSDRFYYDYAP